MAAGAAKGGLKCMQCCGYCCQCLASFTECSRSVWNGITKVLTCGQGWKGLFSNTLTICGSEEDPDYKHFGLPVVTDRRITDFPTVFLFLGTLVGMMVVMNRAITYGRPEIYTKGHDKWGNVCGTANEPITGVTTSGLNMNDQARVLIVDFITRPADLQNDLSTFADITQLCVAHCPATSNPFACSEYLNDAAVVYPSALRSRLCQSAPAKQDLEFEVKNLRCVPSGFTQDWSIQKQNMVLNLYGQNWLLNLINDSHLCAAELTWISLIALGFTLLFILVTYGAADALCWYSFATFFLAGVGATSYMWYLWTLIVAADQEVTARSAFSTRTVQSNELRAALRLLPRVGDTNSSQAVPQLGYSIVFRDAAIYSTTVVVVFSVVSVMVGKRNMDAAAALFSQATAGLASVKWIYLLPLLSICSISFALGLWLYTVKHVTTIFLPDPKVETDDAGQKRVTYVPDTLYSVGVLIFEVFSLLWVVSFIMACQYLITCLAIATWYFSIDKESMFRPMRVASSRLIRRHLGTAALGSIIVGLFGYLRAPLSFLQSRVVSSKENAANEVQKQLLAANATPDSSNTQQVEQQRVSLDEGNEPPVSQGPGQDKRQRRKYVSGKRSSYRIPHKAGSSHGCHKRTQRKWIGRRERYMTYGNPVPSHGYTKRSLYSYEAKYVYRRTRSTRPPPSVSTYSRVDYGPSTYYWPSDYRLPSDCRVPTSTRQRRQVAAPTISNFSRVVYRTPSDHVMPRLNRRSRKRPGPSMGNENAQDNERASTSVRQSHTGSNSSSPEPIRTEPNNSVRFTEDDPEFHSADHQSDHAMDHQQDQADDANESEEYEYYEELLDDNDQMNVEEEEPDGQTALLFWTTVHRGFSPFFWFLNTILIYISDLNYAVVALRGYWFFQSGRLIRSLLAANPHLKGINAISSYALFLGKLTITIAVLPFGFLLLKDKEGVFMYGYPLAVGAGLSFIIAHVFISLFEAAVSCVFMCYLEDMTLNDGTMETPYFGRKSFFQSFHNALNQVTALEAGPYTKIHYSRTDILGQKSIERDRLALLSETEDFDEIHTEYERMDRPPRPPPPHHQTMHDPYSDGTAGVNDLMNVVDPQSLIGGQQQRTMDRDRWNSDTALDGRTKGHSQHPKADHPARMPEAPSKHPPQRPPPPNLKRQAAEKPPRPPPPKLDHKPKLTEKPPRPPPPKLNQKPKLVEKPPRPPPPTPPQPQNNMLKQKAKPPRPPPPTLNRPLNGRDKPSVSVPPPPSRPPPPKHIAESDLTTNVKPARPLPPQINKSIPPPPRPPPPKVHADSPRLKAMSTKPKTPPQIPPRNAPSIKQLQPKVAPPRPPPPKMSIKQPKTKFGFKPKVPPKPKIFKNKRRFNLRTLFKKK